MKLFYYKDTQGNFGDDLNPWIWDRLIKTPFNDNDHDELFVGIGTILNHLLPKKPLKHVFGSGYGYGPSPVVDKTFEFHAVRGPLTADALGIDSNKAITDSAILIRVVEDLPGPAGESKKFGFVPHHTSNYHFDWQVICDVLDYKFLDVSWPVEKFLSELRSCEFVICEAMHGAIVADALRIPWLPVKCYDHISEFKWHDWMLTIGIEYQPTIINSLFDNVPVLTPYETFKNITKISLKKLGLFSSKWSPPRRVFSSPKKVESVTKRLANVGDNQFFLSQESICNELTDKYATLVEQFNHNH